MTSQRQGPTLGSLLILICIALTTMATSPDGSASGQSEDRLDWEGNALSATVTIAPIESRVDPGNDQLKLALTIDEVPATESEGVLWRLTMAQDDDEAYVAEGAFELEGDIEIDENGIRRGDLHAQVGPFCRGDGEAPAQCVPCDVQVGCTFDLDVTFCDGAGTEEKSIWVMITGETGRIFSNECLPYEDHARCDALDDWVIAEQKDTVTDLCSEMETTPGESE